MISGMFAAADPMNEFFQVVMPIAWGGLAVDHLRKARDGVAPQDLDDALWRRAQVLMARGLALAAFGGVAALLGQESTSLALMGTGGALYVIGRVQRFRVGRRRA